MAQLLGVKIQNYKSLKEITLGQIGYGVGMPLPSLCCFIGPNGCGKSTLLDAFGFMADCLREGVEAACDKPERGGLDKLRTQGSNEPIQFSLYYREGSTSRPISYEFTVGDKNGIPTVVKELLRQRRKGQKRGQPFSFLRLENGVGSVWAGESTDKSEGDSRLDVKLDDTTRLAVTSLGQFKEHPRIVGLRNYIESWYLSYFVPDAARKLGAVGVQKHLDRTGENIGNVVQYLERSHPKRFNKILERVSQRIPGITKISHKKSPDGRLLLQFNENGYNDPFYQQSMSDGTLKMFAYLLLLEDPEPRPFIGIEEPENGLYHKLLEDLASEFNRYTQIPKKNIQMLLTTHSPHFIDALRPEQVWLMEKNEQGHTEIFRIADMDIIVALKNEGIPLGSIWYSNHLEQRFSI